MNKKSLEPLRLEKVISDKTGKETFVFIKRKKSNLREFEILTDFEFACEPKFVAIPRTKDVADYILENSPSDADAVYYDINVFREPYLQTKELAVDENQQPIPDENQQPKYEEIDFMTGIVMYIRYLNKKK